MSALVILNREQVNFNLNEVATKFIKTIDEARTVGGFNPILGNKKYFDKNGECHEAEASSTFKDYIYTVVYFCNREIDQKFIREGELFESMGEYNIPTFVENFVVPCSVTLLSTDGVDKASSYRRAIECNGGSLLRAAEFNLVTKAIKGALSLNNDPGMDLMSCTSAKVISDVKSRIMTPNGYVIEPTLNKVYVPITLTPFDENYGYSTPHDHFDKVIERVISNL